MLFERTLLKKLAAKTLDLPNVTWPVMGQSQALRPFIEQSPTPHHKDQHVSELLRKGRTSEQFPNKLDMK
jgi:hypothetical protein